jgi:hypothetical protein
MEDHLYCFWMAIAEPSDLIPFLLLAPEVMVANGRGARNENGVVRASVIEKVLLNAILLGIGKVNRADLVGDLHEISDVLWRPNNWRASQTATGSLGKLIPLQLSPVSSDFHHVTTQEARQSSGPAFVDSVAVRMVLASFRRNGLAG